MVVNLNNVIAVTESAKGSGSSFAVTNTTQGFRNRIPMKVLEYLEITQEEFRLKEARLSFYFLETNLLICKSKGGEGLNISGSYTSPKVYSSALGKQVMAVLGKEIEVNKTVSFYSMSEDKIEDSGEKIIVIDLTAYNSNADTFVTQMPNSAKHSSDAVMGEVSEADEPKEESVITEASESADDTTTEEESLLMED